MEKSKPNRFKKTKSENMQFKSFLQIQLIAILTYTSLFIIGCLIALKADLSSKYDFIFALCTFIVGSFITGFASGIKLRKNGLFLGIIFSLPMNILVVLISVIICKFDIGFNLGVTIFILLISSGIGGILAVNKRIRL